MRPPRAPQAAQDEIAATLQVKLHLPEQDMVLSSYATDLFSEGLVVRTGRPLPDGTVVRIELDQGGVGGSPTTVAGRVTAIHQGGGFTAMELTFDTPDDRQLAGLVGRFRRRALRQG